MTSPAIAKLRAADPRAFDAQAGGHGIMRLEKTMAMVLRKIDPETLTVKLGGTAYGPTGDACRDVLRRYLADGNEHVYIQEGSIHSDTLHPTATAFYADDRWKFLAYLQGPDHKCPHLRLNEDGQCRSCGADCRGVGPSGDRPLMQGPGGDPGLME
jgi:hypothetical protein